MANRMTLDEEALFDRLVDELSPTLTEGEYTLAVDRIQADILEYRILPPRRRFAMDTEERAEARWEARN